MTEDFSERNEPNEIRSGNFSKVEMRDNDVVMEPRSNFPGKIADMNEKMGKQETFNKMFENFEGIEICEIKEKDTSKGRYVVERAEGINLSQIDGEKDGEIKEFLNLRVDVKSSALLTYVKMIEVLNSKNISFTDHKGDSIFVQSDYNSPLKSKISIVDAGSLSSHENQQEAWRKDLNGGLVDALKSFYTRGIGYKEFGGLIPNGIKEILDNIESYPDAKVLCDRLNAYIHGKSESTINPNKRKMDLFNKAAQAGVSDDIRRRIWEKDYNKLSQFEIDSIEVYINKFNLTKNLPLMKALERK